MQCLLLEARGTLGTAIMNDTRQNSLSDRKLGSYVSTLYCSETVTNCQVTKV